MLFEISLVLSFVFVQHTHADDVCFYTNRTHLIAVRCDDVCCYGRATSAKAACCSRLAWRFIVPVIIIIFLCLLGICLLFSRPFIKNVNLPIRPWRRRSQISTLNPISAHHNDPVYVLNNDLPDYETVNKNFEKDVIPPSYNFVAAHPTDFGIDARVPTSPPLYRSRASSVTAAEPNQQT